MMKSPIISKRCSRCGIEKSAFAFHRKMKEATGLNSQCRMCVSFYYVDNKERMNENSRRWYKENIEVVKPKRAQWRQDNAEYVREYSAQYRKEHPDKVYAVQRRWKDEHPEMCRAQKARRRQRENALMDDLDRHLSVEYRKAIANDPCFYCGGKGEHDDHFFPLAKGGTDHWYNLVRACESCNLSKHAKCGTWFVLKVA
jgi:5-methylcytosine-specific restriction endonuclease McrA